MRWSQEQFDDYNTRIRQAVFDMANPDAPDPGPESRLQRKIEAWSRDWGRPCLSLRQSPHAKRLLPAGWPDICLICPGGKVIFIELKSGSGRLSDEQKRLRLQFMALGHEIHEVRSFKRFLEVVQ